MITSRPEKHHRIAHVVKTPKVSEECAKCEQFAVRRCQRLDMSGGDRRSVTDGNLMGICLDSASTRCLKSSSSASLSFSRARTHLDSGEVLAVFCVCLRSFPTSFRCDARSHSGFSIVFFQLHVGEHVVGAGRPPSRRSASRPQPPTTSVAAPL